MTKKSPENSYSHIFKYTGLLGGVQVLNVLMNIIRTKCTAFFIGTYGMGLANLYIRNVQWVGDATNFGIGFSAVRRLSALSARGEREAIALYVRLIRTWTLLTAAFGTLLCLLLSPAISLWTLGDTHTAKGYALLSPVVGLLTLTGGEIAILKGLHRLKRLALAGALSALATVVLTIPLYAWLGLHGVIPVLLTTTAATFLFNLRATTRLYPYRVGLGSRKLLRAGGHMISLGSAYAVAGFCGTGADAIIFSFISTHGSLNALGIYTFGAALIVAYARLFFSSMDADYFPRLSVAGNDAAGRNTLINRQIDVLVVLMAPMLTAFALAMPLLIRLLATADFLLGLNMIILALPYVFFKAVYSPISYLPLARGDSLTYMGMELLYDAVYVVCVTVGFQTHGLTGAGLGLTLANLFDLLSVATVYHYRYSYRPDVATLRRCLVQGLLLLGGLVAALQPAWGMKLGVGLPLFGLSCAYSYRLLSRETSLSARLRLRRSRHRD